MPRPPSTRSVEGELSPAGRDARRRDWRPWIVDSAIAVGFTAAVVLITHKIEGTDDAASGARLARLHVHRRRRAPSRLRRRAPLTVLAVITVAIVVYTSPLPRRAGLPRPDHRDVHGRRHLSPPAVGLLRRCSRPAASARPGSSTNETGTSGSTSSTSRGASRPGSSATGPAPAGVPPRLGGTGQVPGGVPRGGVAPARRRGAAPHRPGHARRRRPQPRLDQHPGRRGRARRRRPSGPGAAALVAIKTASKEALDELRLTLGVLRSGGEAAPRAPVPSLARLDALVARTERRGCRSRSS